MYTGTGTSCIASSDTDIVVTISSQLCSREGYAVICQSQITGSYRNVLSSVEVQQS